MATQDKRQGPGRPAIGKLRGLRCSDELWERVEEAAKKANLPVSEWVRLTLSRALEP